MADKNEWGSNMSFILAMIGSAVGLGNIWRYPYVLYSWRGSILYPLYSSDSFNGNSILDIGVWCRI